MSTPEGKVKAWAYRKLEQTFPDAFSFSPRGGPYAVAGIPDRIMCVNGLFVGIEVKADENSPVTARQLGCLKAIIRAGGIAAVLRGKDERKLNAIIHTIRSRSGTDQHS